MKTVKKIILVATIPLFALSIAGCTKKETATVNTDTNVGSTTNNATNETKTLTPEEVIAQMDAAEGVGLTQGPIQVAIVSPTEKMFLQSQARFYNAEVSGLVQGSSCTCNWKFYLNEYDEETLYQQMNGRQCTGTDTQGTLECGFTSTFINSKGDLRVHVDVEVKKDGEVVQSEAAEANYRVE